MSKIHLLTESSIQWLKQQAKALKKKSNSITLSQAQYEIAVQHGFLNWKNLTDTFKHETSSPFRLRHIERDRGSIEPFTVESKVIQTEILSSQGVDLHEYNEKQFDIIDSEYFSETAQKIRDLVSQANSEAQEIVAKNHGFCNWSELLKSHIKEVIIEEYSLEQKIGAICRKLGINPATLKNTIHVAIEMDNDGLLRTNSDEWEKVGLIEDHQFSKWMHDNDSFFQYSSPVFFRLISIDTRSFSKIENHLIQLGEKLDLFFPVFANAIWINGKIDKNIIQSIKDDNLFHEPDIDLDSIEYPPKEIPTEFWKGGY